MRPEVTAAIIAAAAAILAALITAFHKEIKNLFSRTVHDYLEGAWACHWETSSPAASAAIDDEVRIQRVRGALVKGKGNNVDYGDYYLSGEASDFVLTLNYDGADKSKGLAGVVMLQKVSPTVLRGVWSQLSAKGGLKGGSTDWTKK